MPLDPTKLHEAILAQASHHTDDCEFCKFFTGLYNEHKVLQCMESTADILMLGCATPFDFFWQCFQSGFIMGVKMERARVMEEEFRL